MPKPEPAAGITFKVIQEMMPEYHLSPDLLHGLAAALPPPPADADKAWRHERITRVIDEIAARVPMDPAQAHLAGQIAVVQFMADDMAGRVDLPGQTPAEMHRLVRSTGALWHTVSRLERTLERRQFRVMPFRDVKAAEGFDLEVLDGAWCRRTPPAKPAARPPAEARPAERPPAEANAAAGVPPDTPARPAASAPPQPPPAPRDPAMSAPAKDFGNDPPAPAATVGEPAAPQRAAEPAPPQPPPAPQDPTLPEPATDPGNHPPAQAATAGERTDPAAPCHAGEPATPHPAADLAWTEETREHTATDAAGQMRRYRIEVEHGDGWSLERWHPLADAPADTAVGSPGIGEAPDPRPRDPRAAPAAALAPDAETAAATAEPRYPCLVDDLAAQAPPTAMPSRPPATAPLPAPPGSRADAGVAA